MFTVKQYRALRRLQRRERMIDTAIIAAAMARDLLVIGLALAVMLLWAAYLAGSL